LFHFPFFVIHHVVSNMAETFRQYLGREAVSGQVYSRSNAKL